MNRKNFLKALSAILVAPKALANIKPEVKYIDPKIDYKLSFPITQADIDSDIYKVDRNAWLELSNDIDNYFYMKRRT